MSRSLRLGAIFLVQALVLASMIGQHAWTLSTGSEVLLETEPVDPRDLFRGDYVVLTYDISRLPAELLPEVEDLSNGDAVYVVLEPDGRPWRAVAATTDAAILDTHDPDQVVIRGFVERVMYSYARYEDGELVEPRRPLEIRMRYGIESYFVRAGTGRDLERIRDDRDTSLEILVAVNANGRAAIKAVFVGGELYAEEGIF